MAGIFDTLDDILKEITEHVKVTKTNPEGSLVRGTLVRHIEEPKVFGVVLDSYETENKDIYNQKINYYNILWGANSKSNDKYSASFFSYGDTSLEPETDLIAWHGFIFNK
tara:strand:+ start:25 stop:354 length:330 start_codon:yes stop_codon:yes gene_type:complete